jgi:hypothetical protein
MVFSYPAQIRAIRANSGPAVVLATWSRNGFHAHLLLGSGHLCGYLAVVSAGRFGVVGDGVDGEVLPALRRLLLRQQGLHKFPPDPGCFCALFKWVGVARPGSFGRSGSGFRREQGTAVCWRRFTRTNPWTRLAGMPITSSVAWDGRLEAFKGRDSTDFVLTAAYTVRICAACGLSVQPGEPLSLRVDITQGASTGHVNFRPRKGLAVPRASGQRTADPGARTRWRRIPF